MFSIFRTTKLLVEHSVFPFGNIDYPLIYKPNPRSKRLSLRHAPKQASLVLTVPPRATQSQINTFLKRCIPWVEKQITQASYSSKIIPGAEVKLNGSVYTCVSDPLRRKPALCKVTQTLRLPPRVTQKSLYDFFKQVAMEQLAPLVTSIAQTIGQTIEKVTVRDTKSRWGSCSTRKTISLNWRLIFAPPEVAHYVCAHEAAHLIHMNHSKDFWKLVENLCPYYKDQRKWLKTNGTSLLSI